MMKIYVDPAYRDLGANAENYRVMNAPGKRTSKRTSRAFIWWLRAVAATAAIGFAIFAADRALPGIAATAIEAEQQAELYLGGW